MTNKKPEEILPKPEDKLNDANKELDRLTNLGLSAVYRIQKLSDEIKEYIEGPEGEQVKKDLKEYIFGGDPKAVSPLAGIRAKHK